MPDSPKIKKTGIDLLDTSELTRLREIDARYIEAGVRNPPSGSTRFSTFSGADIKVFCPVKSGDGTIENITLGDIQTISVSVNRNTRTARGLGSTQILGLKRGTRMIAGSMVGYQFMDDGINAIKQSMFSGIGDPNTLLLDQLPPLNIIISYANEYGQNAYSAIFGVHIITEGEVLSIQDLTTERTLQYIALDYQPLRRPPSRAMVVGNEALTGPSISDILEYESGGSVPRNNPYLDARRAK